jgi:hypothetical protein
MKVKISNYTKHKPQRVNVEIEHFDTYNMCNTLASIIYPMLLQLREVKHGIPSEFVDNIGGEDYVEQESFDFYKESYDDAHAIGCKRWDEVLDKIIWSFYQLINTDWEEQYHHGELKMSWVETDRLYQNPITGKTEKTYQMVDENPDEHWFDIDGYMLHQQRIQEGLELFGKYFQNLWD